MLREGLRPVEPDSLVGTWKCGPGSKNRREMARPTHAFGIRPPGVVTYTALAEGVSLSRQKALSVNDRIAVLTVEKAERIRNYVAYAG